jgi:hypothetical protein
LRAFSQAQLSAFLVCAVSLSASACSAPDAPEQARLDRIAEKCGLPKAALKKQDDAIHFAPPEDANFTAVDCAMTELKGLPGGLPKMGFVGNERYESEATNAQKN